MWDEYPHRAELLPTRRRAGKRGDARKADF